MGLHYSEWPDSIKHDFIGLFLAERLGEGCAREVFAAANDAQLVFKVENVAASFQNVLEWETWQQVRYTKWAKWFAPCIQISNCGIVLAQARTTPLPPDRVPRQLPNFLTDLKPSNFGLYKGRVVAHDYALNLAASNGLAQARVRKLQKGELS